MGFPIKREYRKPYLAVESFQLDAAIAGACTVDLMYSVDTCTYVDVDGDNNDSGYFGTACGAENGVDVSGLNTCYHAMVYEGVYLIS